MALIPTRFTYYSSLASAQTVFTDSRRIHSILVTNSSVAAVTVSFTDSDDSAITSIVAPAKGSFSWDLVWIAENGLKVGSASSNVTLTVAHSASGV